KREFVLLDLGYVRSLRALLTLHNLELDLISLLETLITFGSDCAVVYEDVGTAFVTDKTVTFGVVKPLYCSFQTFHVAPWGTDLTWTACLTIVVIVLPSGWGVKT